MTSAPPSLDALAQFACVAKCRSFTQAARQLGLSPSALSHSMRELEARLGLRLLHRSTRSVSPTDAGLRLLTQLAPALVEVEQAVRVARDEGETPNGVLRLNVPRAAATLVLSPVLPEFHARCPQVQLEIVCQDGLVDIVAQGFDAGVRFGEQLAQDMIAVALQPAQGFAVVAAPQYLAQHGAPQHPRDVQQHDCINRRFPSGVHYDWEFERRGQALQVRTQGPLTLDDERLILDAACAGLGLAYVYEQQALSALAQGQLQRVLVDWCPPAEHFYLYHPSRRHVPVALRTLIELLTQSTT